jgi:hypothetical protein
MVSAHRHHPHVVRQRRFTARLEVCDGNSLFANEAYVPLDWGIATASALRVFGQQIYGGLLDLKAGKRLSGQKKDGRSALRAHIKNEQEPLEKTLRRVLREELKKAS